MAARGRSNPLALAVLALLSERPMHPYEMSSLLRERRKEDSIKLNFGSLYAVVESLRKRGLIDAQETERDGRRPQRTVYAITDAGRVELTDWMTGLISTPVKEYPQFEAALSLIAVLGPDEVINLLEARLKSLRYQHDAYEQAITKVGKFPRLFLIEAEYGHAMRAAEIEFVDKLVTELRSGEFDGVAAWRRMDELREAGVTADKVLEQVSEEFKEEMAWFAERIDEFRSE